MSYKAMRWAMEQAVKPAITKFVLVTMAECVNAENGAMEFWPSYAHLARRTGASQNTVEASVYRLRAEGYIVDTGKREGGTGKVIVYRLNDPKTGTIPPTNIDIDEGIDASATRAQTTPLLGLLTAQEIPPNLSGNPPKNDPKSPQKRGLMTPDLGYGTRKEPGRNQEGTKKSHVFDPTTIPLPEWLDRESWCLWCRDRKKRGKTVSEDAAPLQIRTLTKYRQDGFTPLEVIEHSISNGYQGLYPPKRATSRHAGFRKRQYEEGVTDGTPDA